MNMRAHLEDIAIASDHRSCSRAEAPVLFMPDGEEVKLPMKWELCPVCNGAGTHVNPSIDAGGISSEDFEEDPDFRERYMAGDYDVTCNRCARRTTVPVVDLDRLKPEQRAAWDRQQREERADYYERMAELRAGA
jgi:hypothetical protein